jgi:hypothetical protein
MTAQFALAFLCARMNIAEYTLAIALQKAQKPRKTEKEKRNSARQKNEARKLRQNLLIHQIWICFQ